MLENVIPKLRKRIQDIRDRKEPIGEQNTKATLIDPLLSALGWDLQELDEVRREYRREAQDKPVDYALFLLREPRLFIEAKALDEDLTNRKYVSQILNYANVVGVEWCVLTNGDEYRLFNSHAPVDIEEKLFRSVRISVLEGEQQSFALQTLELLSKEKMAENLLNRLWKAHFVDRKVKSALEKALNEDPGLIRLLHRKTDGLTPSVIRASLKRAVIRIDFPMMLPSLDAPVSSIPRRTPERESKAPERQPSDRRRRAGLKAWDTMQKTKEASVLSLVEAGLIQPPLNLEREYKGTRLKAVVQNDGTVTFDGKSYDSLSTAGGMARKSVIGAPQKRPYPQTNGWTFWKYRDQETGKLLEIDVLRQQYLKKSQHSTARA